MPRIEFPITVNAIEFKETEVLEEKVLFGGKCGDMVRVRPCAERYGNKTYMGVLLGEIALSIGCSLNEESGILTVQQQMHNPAIFIPECNSVVYGCGSWWGRIENEEQLRSITDGDINNVWYVKALSQLGKIDGGEEVATGDAERRF